MKQAQIKSIMILALVMLLGFATVFALTVTLNNPVSTWSTTNPTVFNFTPSGESTNIDWCALYTNTSGTWTKTANYSNVANGTPYLAGIGLGNFPVGVLWKWNVKCYNGSNEVWGTLNRTFFVDWHFPTVSLDSPSNGEYIDSASDTLSFTPTDPTNLDECVLYSNVTGTWGINHTFSTVTSGTQDSGNLTAQSDGSYIWNVVCNQSSGDKVWGATAGNYSFVLDTTAPADIQVAYPTNNTVSSDTTPTIRWNQTTEINFDQYNVYVSTNLSNLEGSAAQNIAVSNRTGNATTLTAELVTDVQYYIWVKATDLAGNTKNTSDVFYYAVDSTSPSLTLNNPSDGDYTTDTTPDFNITVVDNNPDSCNLYLSNSTGGNVVINATIEGIVSGTTYNMTPTPMSDGAYQFNIECNDSTGTRVNVSSSLMDVVIDTLSPTQPNITSTWHQTNSTDTTPILRWTTVTETNFDKYVVEAKNVSGDDVVEQINVSTRTTNYTTFTGLPTGVTYNFSVTAYDLAGNTAKSANTTDTWYYVDPVCGILYAGWNLCGIVATTPRNLSVIGAETSATLVTVWNSSHEWQTCVYGVSNANCNVKVGVAGANYTSVWVYVDSQTAWQNRTWSAVKTSADITLSNTTVGWNLFGNFVRNGLTFEQLNSTTRLHKNNVTAYSLRYNNGTNSIPYITIDSFSSLNADTKVRFGESLWVYYNGTGNTTFDVGGW